MAIEKVKFNTENGAAVQMVIDGQVVVKSIGEAMLLDGLTEWLVSGGKIDPFYTITSAELNRSDSDKVISLQTVEAGRVNITAEGNPMLWSLYQNWLNAGGKLLPFQDRNKEGREAAEASAALKQKRDNLLDAMIAQGITPENVANKIG